MLVGIGLSEQAVGGFPLGLGFNLVVEDGPIEHLHRDMIASDVVHAWHLFMHTIVLLSK